MLLAHTSQGIIDGYPCIYIWDAMTFKKLNQIAISEKHLISVEFAPLSNMLLVVSSDSLDQDAKSTIAVWDFLDGCKDVFCKSQMPRKIVGAKWNPYTSIDVSEFVTLCEGSYHYWRVSNNLQLDYQEGHIDPQHKQMLDKTATLNTLEFVVPSPTCVSTFMAIGLTNGYIWISDVRTNQHIFSVKVLDGISSVDQIVSEKSKVTIWSRQD
jgi:hypothetical protein